MNYANIKYCDIANGEGVRTTLFVSGCRHYCKDCFNQVAWSFDHGSLFDRSVEDKIIGSLKPTYISGLTLLGGEPMEKENQEALLPFLKRVRWECPNKTIWLFSGFTFEELTGAVDSRAFSDNAIELLKLCDILVDGKFVADEKDITLQFRGSRNQRVIDLPKTFAHGEVVVWEKLKK